jgi:hypothetical protein
VLSNKARIGQRADRAYRGDKDHAFQWIERTYVRRDPGLTYLKVQSDLEKLERRAALPIVVA